MSYHKEITQDEWKECHCNKCGHKTAHTCDILTKKDITENEHEDEIVTYSLYCNGCNTPCIVSVYFNSTEYVRHDLVPPIMWAKKPNWVEQIEELDNILYGLLNEVYSSANYSQTRLFSMGIRACLDHSMVYILKGDYGSFKDKMTQMVKEGHISARQQDMLETVIDAGSASAHRGYNPNIELLSQMLALLETIIRDLYITSPMLQSLKSHIPPKPPHQKPKK